MMKLGASFALLLLIFANLDLDGLRHHKIYWGPVALLMVNVSLQNLFSCLRWRVFLRGLGLDLPFRSTLLIVHLTLLLGNLMPSSLLAEVARYKSLSRLGRAGDSFSSIVLDRLSGYLILVPASILGLALNPIAQEWRRYGLLFVIALGLVVGLLLLPKLLRRFSRIEGGVRLRLLLTEPAHLLWTSLFLGSLTGNIYFSLLSLGTEVDYSQLLLLYMPVLLLMCVPISIAGFGLREVGAMTMLTSLGMSTETIALAALMTGIATCLGSLPGVLMLHGSRLR